MLYEVAGISIESDIPLPRLPHAPSERHSSIDIRIAEVKELPPRPADCILEGSHSWTSTTVWITSQAGSCACAVSPLGLSYVRRPYTPEREVQRLIFYALPAAFAAAGWCMVHGSAISFGDGAWLLLGKSGAGKSTTTAVLAAMGASIIADDDIFVRLDESGKPLVWGIEPRVALTQESRQVLLGMGLSVPSVTEPRNDGKVLYSFAECTNVDAVPVRRVTVLDAPPPGRSLDDSFERFTIMMRSFQYTGLSRHLHGATLMRVCGELVKAGEWRSERSRDLTQRLFRDGLGHVADSKPGFAGSREGVALI